MTVDRETKGIILAVLAAIFSGIAIPANKFFIVNLDPAVFTAVRSVIIGAVFLVLSAYPAVKGRKRFSTAPWKYLIAIAAIGGAAAFLLYYTGLKLTTAGRAAVLYHTLLATFTVVIAYVFFSEKISRRMAYALAAMFAGTVILYVSQVPQSQLWADPNLGDLLIIGASLLWAIEYNISRKVMKMGETNLVVSFARMFFGGLILFGFVFISGNMGALLALSLQQWANILISTALLFAYVLFWYWSMKYINVSKATTLLLLAPIISLVGGVVFLGEPVPAMQLAGSAIMLAGAYFVMGAKSESRKKA